MTYFVYILECKDGSYYTGTTNDVGKRFLAHISGSGASYTRSHKPVKIIYTEELIDKSSALKREIAIKKLSRIQKEVLVNNGGSR